MWIIYCHIHISTGRRYIGLTSKTWRQRWDQHVSQAKIAKGSRRWHFPNAIRKYGKDAFSHRILQKNIQTLEEANAAEQYWIEKYKTRDPKRGFNVAKKGLHIPHAVTNPWKDPNYRQKSLVSLLKRNTNPRVRASISRVLTGRKLSPEHIAHMSASLTGKKHSQEHIAKVAMANMKSYCKRGHSLHNAMRSNGKRKCRICERDYNTKRRSTTHHKQLIRRSNYRAYQKLKALKTSLGLTWKQMAEVSTVVK